MKISCGNCGICYCSELRYSVRDLSINHQALPKEGQKKHDLVKAFNKSLHICFIEILRI